MEGVCFEAVPNSGTVKISSTNNNVSFILPNRTIFTENIQKHLSNFTTRVIHSGQPQQNLKLHANWVVNRLADSDEYSHALNALSQAISGKIAVFNHPDAVAASRRDKSSLIMQGIPNLLSPQCVRFVPQNSNDSIEVMREFNLHFPILVRPACSQSGKGLRKVESNAELLSYMQINKLNTPYYLTQLIDFQRISEGNTFTKIRLAFVGSKMFLRGFAEQPQWNINRAFGNQTSNLDVEKFLFLEKSFDKMKNLNNIGKEICKRGQLDFWGVDLGYLGKGKYVLFEANAAMSILRPQGLSTSQSTMIQPLVNRIERELLNHLQNRHQWVLPFGHKS